MKTATRRVVRGACLIIMLEVIGIEVIGTVFIAFVACLARMLGI